MPDQQTLVLAQAALNCLTIAVTGNPNPPNLICYRVGQEVAYDAAQFDDLCCEGLAYVSMGDVYPSVSSFPDQDIIRQVDGNCVPPAWAVEFRMGIVRCAPVGDANFPPSCADWNAAFVQSAQDSQALRAAVCCLRSWLSTSTQFLGMSMVIQRQTQSNPSGGCMERVQPLVVQFQNCDCG